MVSPHAVYGQTLLRTAMVSGLRDLSAFDLTRARSLTRAIQQICRSGNEIVLPATPNRALPFTAVRRAPDRIQMSESSRKRILPLGIWVGSAALILGAGAGAPAWVGSCGKQQTAVVIVESLAAVVYLSTEETIPAPVWVWAFATTRTLRWNHDDRRHNCAAAVCVNSRISFRNSPE